MRATPQVKALSWLVARPIAHRGLHDAQRGIVENTAGAFAAAIAENYAIECDLQIAGDGEAMVFHDDRLDRLCEARGAVKAHTVTELQRLAIRGSRDRMQTLEELLDQVEGRVPLVIELKTHWDGDTALAKRALRVLASYRGAFGLMSFDPDLIAAVRGLAPNTVRGIAADRAVDPHYNAIPVARRRELQCLSHVGRTRPHFLSYCFADLPWPPVARYRAAGNPVISWTIRSAAEAAAARRYSDQITFEGFRA
jgi:glycerophosphoryl diester phosphodiesterase